MTHYDRLDAALADGMAIAFHASQAPTRLALDSEFGARTFSELNARVNQLARVLRGSGLEPDDAGAIPSPAPTIAQPTSSTTCFK